MSIAAIPQGLGAEELSKLTVKKGGIKREPGAYA